MQHDPNLSGNRPNVRQIKYNSKTKKGRVQIGNNPLPLSSTATVEYIDILSFDDFNYFFDALLANVGSDGIMISHDTGSDGNLDNIFIGQKGVYNNPPPDITAFPSVLITNSTGDASILMFTTFDSNNVPIDTARVPYTAQVKIKKGPQFAFYGAYPLTGTYIGNYNLSFYQNGAPSGSLTNYPLEANRISGLPYFIASSDCVITKANTPPVPPLQRALRNNISHNNINAIRVFTSADDIPANYKQATLNYPVAPGQTASIIIDPAHAGVPLSSVIVYMDAIPPPTRITVTDSSDTTFTGIQSNAYAPVLVCSGRNSSGAPGMFLRNDSTFIISLNPA